MTHATPPPDLDLWQAWHRAGGPKYPHEKVVQYTFRHFPPDARAAAHALDLGCGSGVHCWFLAREGFRVAGTDIAPAGLENTARRLAADGLSAELIEAPADRQPFADASFDFVICFGVLEVLPSRAAQDGLVGEMSRVLRPGGRALALFASPDDYRCLDPEKARGIPFLAPAPDEVARMFGGRFARVDIDRYITTYEGGRWQQNDFLVTCVR